MSDFLLESSLARSLIRNLGLPLPVPEPLDRGRGPWEERPLEGFATLVGAAAESSLLTVVARTLGAAGAQPFVVADELRAPIDAVTEGYGRATRSMASLGDSSLRAILFDASTIRDVSGLAALHAFFHASIDRLARAGRIVVLARPAEEAADAEAAAAQRALEGFVRSVAKEVGRRGATAQTLIVAAGAEANLEGPLRFVLSRRSAFVTAQPIRIGARVASPGEIAFVRPLDRKIAMVTGAARGIGQATAIRLAEEGATVVCLDRPEDGEAAGVLARQIGGSTLLADVAAPESPAAIAAAIADRHGGLDVLVHNAGVTRDRTLGRMDAKLWAQALDVNLAAPVRITRALLDAGLVRDGAHLVALSSIAGISGNVGQSNYAAAKAGLIGWVGRLAEDLAPRGITVNAVAPGFIETRMTAAVPLFVREAGRRLAALGQGGLPTDVAEAITFLASPGAVGITGGVLRVCGGALLGA